MASIVGSDGFCHHIRSHMFAGRLSHLDFIIANSLGKAMSDRSWLKVYYLQLKLRGLS